MRNCELSFCPCLHLPPAAWSRGHIPLPLPLSLPPNLHLLATKQEHKELGQLDVIGREVECTQCCHGLSGQQLDTAHVNHKEQDERAGEVAVPTHDNLVVHDFDSPSGEFVLVDIESARVGIPEPII